ncbi:Cytochrome p450 [Thalictrum thalictroides]|uniref:Cytochrome p450 n=1 Tax=Thalictrum thalictroides TaxID=46969 RepID=A0A7J6W2X1_THATH|nr:Cytochrome p450 [Thalictrum thalictroides]
MELHCLLPTKSCLSIKGKPSIPKIRTGKLPPGPLKLPLIGHLHHLLGMPHHSFRDLAKEHGPLMYLELGEVPTVVVTSPKVAKEMMKTNELMFVDRPLNLATKIMSYECMDVIMAPYGDYWKQVRKICMMELLGHKRVQSFWSVREEEVTSLVGRISNMVGSPVNLSQSIISVTNDITARATFGKAFKDRDAFLVLMKEVIRLAAGFDIADLYPSMKFLEALSGTRTKLEKTHLEVDKMLDVVINDHINNKNRIKNENGEFEEDLVDVLLRVQASNELDMPISMDNVKGVILDMFTGGSDTSSTAIEWAFSELLKNPEAMAKAQAEVREVFNGKKRIEQEDMNQLRYIKLVVKETLRMHPPAPLLIPRECSATCEIDGYEIPEKARIIINAWAIGRDPENWSDPDSFKPERFEDISSDYRGNDYRYTPFGSGRRICPGILFAIANVELPIALLLYHFDWKLANGVKSEDLDMTESFGATVRRKNDLYVIPTPYTF